MNKGTKRIILYVGLAGAAYLVYKMISSRQNKYASASYFNPQPNYYGNYSALLAGDSTLITAATVL